MAKDTLFQHNNGPQPFTFNESVATVFDDMVTRSVPHYAQTLHQIAHLMPKNPYIYDLGCSLGALVGAVSQQHAQFQYVGIDKSPHMIARAKRLESPQVRFYEGDICDFRIHDAPTVIVCHLVLQFIPTADRTVAMQHYANGLPQGGRLFIVEKVRQINAELQAAYTHDYHAFKASNGYTPHEIQQKDRALANVLCPQTLPFYMNTLQDLGFQTVDIFFKWYNFVGIVAIK